MDVNEYRALVHEEVALAASANMSYAEATFIKYATDILISGEEFDEFVECYYEGITRRKANMKIEGYAFDEADGSCCVFISDYHGPHDKEDSVRADDINNLFNKLKHFVNEATKHELYLELEESTEVYEFAKTLYLDKERISKFRFYLLTDAFNKQRKKTMKAIEVGDKVTELNVWDIQRLFDIVSSKTQKESVEIVLSEFDSEGIPCVKAVEYKNVKADIEIPMHADSEESNLITYTSYMAVVPGTILNELYLKYGSRLLEGNVRSFLSVKGKVNKSIQSTIKNYPEMFFAYNNGIAATATEMDTEMTETGLVITRIKELQIVNGGQTTASITNTLLHHKKDEIIDISNLYVPMKISVLDHSMSERIIPKISEYSNSQNKVDASDFFSNHPFHIRMEEHSRKTPAPVVGGNQFQQYWFYERTRGQYNQGKMKFKAKSSDLKQYETRYPANQVIKMVELAKYMELYKCCPQIVSKGKQVIVKEFSKDIKDQWDKNNSNFNGFYFKRVVALAIIFKETDNIIKQTDWYRLKHSYKANVVAYTMSVLFNHIHKNLKDKELDFARIWNAQTIYPELEREIRNLCTEVYEFNTDDNRPVENVTQWCKQDRCWELAKLQEWTFSEEFIGTLVSKEDLISNERREKKNQEMDNEIDNMKFIYEAGSKYWKQVYEWGKERNLLNEMEQSILKDAIKMETTGKIPSSKQAKIIIKTRERLISEGMPLKF